MSEWEAIGPQFAHDCDRCTFLGRFDYDGRRHDLYLADHSDHPAGRCVISRHGDAPEDNSSWPVRSAAWSAPWFAEAKRRAVERGLLK